MKKNNNQVIATVEWTDKDVERYIELCRQVGVSEAQKIIKTKKEFRKRNIFELHRKMLKGIYE